MPPLSLPWHRSRPLGPSLGALVPILAGRLLLGRSAGSRARRTARNWSRLRRSSSRRCRNRSAAAWSPTASAWAWKSRYITSASKASSSMARCRFSASMPICPTSRACSTKWPKDSSLATCSNSWAISGRPCLRAWVAYSRYMAKAYASRRIARSRFSRVCGCTVRMASSLSAGRATGRAGLAAARMGAAIRQVGVAQLAQLIAGLADRAGGADDAAQVDRGAATTTSQSAASMVAAAPRSGAG